MGGRGQTLTNLYHNAKKRAARKGLPFDLTQEWIAERVIGKSCPFLGVPFRTDGVRGGRRTQDPLAPSLDRIDPTQGYTLTNTRVVSHQYNQMKARLSDDELLELCKVILFNAGVKEISI